MRAIDDREAGDARGLVDLARRGLTSPHAGDSRDVELDRLMGTWQGEVEARQRARVRIRRAFIAFGATAAAVGAVALLARPARDRALQSAGLAEVAPAVPRRSVEDRHDDRHYVFADGTTVFLTDDAALEIAGAETNRPQVRVGHGEARVHVVHHADKQWTFLAGPFEVEVVGTRFDLAWNAAEQSFTLSLHEGAVNVRGPIIASPLRVHSGQRVLVSLRTGLVSMSAMGAADAPSSAAASLPGHSSGARLPAPAARERTIDHGHEPAAQPTSWRALVGRGQFGEVIAEAQARPLPACFDSCSPEELRALGDAARYSKLPELAERAYLALRRRSVGTRDSAVAAFLLGLTYEAQQRGDEAGKWYARYLAEAPAGELAGEAVAGSSRVARVH